MFGVGGGDIFSAGASIFNNERSIHESRSAAETSWRRGQENQRLANEFTERMSNSAHQREVIDLRAAGLNPILSGTGGGGAPVGSSAMANAPQGVVPNLENPVSSAMEAGRKREEIKNLKNENVRIWADTELKRGQNALANADYNVRLADQDKRQEEVRTQKALTAAAEAQASILTSNAKGAETEGKIDDTKFGEIMRYINRAMRAITGGSSAARNIGEIAK